MSQTLRIHCNVNIKASFYISPLQKYGGKFSNGLLSTYYKLCIVCARFRNEIKHSPCPQKNK